MFAYRDTMIGFMAWFPRAPKRNFKGRGKGTPPPDTTDRDPAEAATLLDKAKSFLKINDPGVVLSSGQWMQFLTSGGQFAVPYFACTTAMWRRHLLVHGIFPHQVEQIH